MNYKRWPVALLVVGTTFLNAFSSTLPFEVTVRPIKNNYSVKENANTNGWKGGFRVKFIVKNVSSSNQGFGYFTCSYYDNWKTDNHDVGLSAWSCKANFLSPEKLEPGKNFSGEVPIYISPSLIGKVVIFKLGFLPYDESKYKSLGTFWSNEIKIKVVE